jgi:peptide-methionine (S)-S-oxide reductase
MDTNTEVALAAEHSTEFEIATLGGGCFWCLEAVFAEIKGVHEVVSGYAGGHVSSPTYRQVCTGSTGHAEVVQVTFDPSQVSYREILQVFFDIHDPTTLNRQGADVGTQYRSAIFYHNQDQQTTAQAFIDELANSGQWQDPIVTELVPLDTFYPAEDYHQEYYAQHGSQPYCQLVIAPKMTKFREHFSYILKPL